MEIRLTALTLGGRRVMLGVARDISERKRAEEALRRERRLLRTMLELQEQDRKLVSYEIHDGLAQQLAGALYKFQSIERLSDRDPDAARELFDEARAAAPRGDGRDPPADRRFAAADSRRVGRRRRRSTT